MQKVRKQWFQRKTPDKQIKGQMDEQTTGRRRVLRRAFTS